MLTVADADVAVSVLAVEIKEGRGGLLRLLVLPLLAEGRRRNGILSLLVLIFGGGEECDVVADEVAAARLG